MRSGYNDIESNRLCVAGIDGAYWPLTATSIRYTGSKAPSAYRLGFNLVDIDASDGPHYRWHGFPLRRLKGIHMA